MATDTQAIINRFRVNQKAPLPYQSGPTYNTAPAMTAPLGTGISRNGTWRPVTTTPVARKDNQKAFSPNLTDLIRNSSGGLMQPTMTSAMYDTRGALPTMSPANPMPAVTGVGNAPGIGAYQQYATTPNNGDPNRLASGSLPFINTPGKPPIDITVGTAGAPQVASIPLPQARPWNAPTEMDLAAIAALESSVMPPPAASAYAPQVAPPPQNPAVAAATTAAQGQAPQTSWMQDMMTGINGLLAGTAPKPLNPQQSYDAANAAAASAAQSQDRSGTGSDGYVRDAAGNVIGRDAQYQGLNPGDMYAQINGTPADNSWKSTFTPDGGIKFGLTAEQRANGARADTGPLRPGLNTGAPAKKPSSLAAVLAGRRGR